MSEDKLNAALFGNHHEDQNIQPGEQQITFKSCGFGCDDKYSQENDDDMQQFDMSQLQRSKSAVLSLRNSHKAKQDLQDMINQIPFPQDDDLSLTSFSNNSQNATPQKHNPQLNDFGRQFQQQPNINLIKHQQMQFLNSNTPASNNYISAQSQHYNLPQLGKSSSEKSFKYQISNVKSLFPNVEQMDDLTASGNSFFENIGTKYNQIVDWNKKHVNPSENKNLFPQVIAPSMEFSNENSASLNFALQNLKNNPSNNMQMQNRSQSQIIDEFNDNSVDNIQISNMSSNNFNPYASSMSNNNISQNQSFSNLKGPNKIQINQLQLQSMQMKNELSESHQTSSIKQISKQQQQQQQQFNPQIVQAQVENGQKRLKSEILMKRNIEIEKELKIKEKIMRKMEQESQFLGQRISELEEKNVFLTEKYKDTSSLEILRGKTLENAKNQIKQIKLSNEKKDQKIQALTIQVQQFMNKEKVIEDAIEKELTELFGQIEKQKVVIGTYSKQLQKLERENKDLRKFNEAGLNENTKRVQSLTKQIEQLLQERNQLIDQQNQQNNNLNQFQNFITQLQDKLKQQEESEAKDKKYINELKQQLDLVMVNIQQEDKLQLNQAGEIRIKEVEDELERQKKYYEKAIQKLKDQVDQQQHSNRSGMNDSRIINVEYLSGTNFFNNTNASFGESHLNKTLNQTKIIDISSQQIVQEDENNQRSNNHNNILQFEELKQKLHEKEEKLKEIQQKLMTTSSENKALKNEKQLIELQLKNQNDQRKNEEILKQQNFQLQQELTKLQFDKSDQTQKLISLEDKLSILQQENEFYNNEKNILDQNQRKNAQTSVKSENEIKKLQQKISSLQQEIQFLQNQVDSQDTQDKTYIDEMNKTWSERVSYLEKQLENNNSEINLKNEQIIQLNIQNREYANLKDRIQQEHEQQNTLIQTNKQLQEKITKILQDQENSQQKLQFKLNEKEEELDKMELQISQYLLEKRKLESQISELKQQLDILNKDLKINKQLYSANNEQDQLQKQINEYQEVIKDFESEQEKLQQNIDNLQSNNLKLEQEKLEFQNKLKEQESQYDYLNQNFIQKQQEIKQLLEIANKSTLLDQELEKKKQISEKQNEKLKQQEKNIQQLKEDVETLNKQLENKENDKQELKFLAEKHEKLQQTVKEKDKKNIDLFNQQKQYQETIKKLEDQLKNSYSENEKNKKLVTQKQADLKIQIQAVKDLKQKNSDLTTKILDLSTKINDYHDQSNQFDNISQQSSIMNEKNYNKLYQEIEHHNQEFQQMKETFSQKLIEMNEKLNLKEEQKQQIINELDQVNKQNQNLQTQNLSLTEKLNNLERTGSFSNTNSNTILFSNMMGSGNKSEFNNPDDLFMFTLERQNNQQQKASQNQYLQQQNQQQQQQILQQNNQQSFIPNISNFNSINSNKENNLNLSNNVPIKNVFKQNILEEFQPEMLSSEETVDFMLEILRRVTKSNEMVKLMINSEEFKQLINVLQEMSFIYEESQINMSTQLDRKQSSMQIFKIPEMVFSSNDFKKNPRSFSNINSNLKSSIQHSEQVNRKYNLSGYY